MTHGCDEAISPIPGFSLLFLIALASLEGDRPRGVYLLLVNGGWEFR
jgi:hypothetical protein